MVDKVAFYTDLDSLFDTRLSTLFSIDKDIVENELTSGRWFTRITNSTTGVDFSVFSKVYKERDNVIYKEAFPTHILGMMTEWLLSIIKNGELGPDAKSTDVIINVHPYKFSEDDLDTIQKGLFLKLGSIADVMLVDMPPEEVTPKYLMSVNVETMAMYDYMTWLETLSEHKVLDTESAPHILLFVPAISFLEKVSTPEEMASGISQIQQLTKPFFNLHHVEIDLFSIAINPKAFK